MNKGQRLDKLLSTSDNGFNHVMQTMIWQHTPKGIILPDEGIIDYMEVLHKAFFFCCENYKTPYTCIAHLSEIADNDEYFLHLIDSVLHLISQSDIEEEMTILFGQLIDLRHQLSPLDEDEGVKASMKEMEEIEQRTDSNTVLDTSTSTSTEGDNSLTHSQIAILYHYINQPITRNNANDIAKKYGHTSGQRLETMYKELTSKLVRTGKGKNRVRDIKAVLPLVTGDVKALVEKELQVAIANNKR